MQFSPNGQKLAVGALGSGQVWLFDVTGSTLANEAGSPFSIGTGSYPNSLGFSGNGDMLAVSDGGTSEISLLGVSSGGLTNAPGTPIAMGMYSEPNGVAFSPGSNLLATADFGLESISVFSLAGPSASIAVPANGATFSQGQAVDASYSCQEPTGGFGLASCAGSVQSGTPIPTSTLGTHTLAVTATSLSGLVGSSSVTYTVVAPAPASIPSNAFTILSRKVTRGTVKLEIGAKAPGVLTGLATFVQAKKVTTGHGRKRRTRVLHKTIDYGKATVKVAGASPVSLTFTPTALGRELLSRLKTLHVKLTISFTPTGGTHRTTTLTVTVVASRPKHSSHSR